MADVVDDTQNMSGMDDQNDASDAPQGVISPIESEVEILSGFDHSRLVERRTVENVMEDNYPLIE
jgi:hypothetical protein